jgi:hypothetical protein
MWDMTRGRRRIDRRITAAMPGPLFEPSSPARIL